MTDREWLHTLDHLAADADEDDSVAQLAAEAHEAEVLKIPAWHVDVRSAFVEAPDGTLVDKDDLLGRT